MVHCFKYALSSQRLLSFRKHRSRVRNHELRIEFLTLVRNYRHGGNIPRGVNNETLGGIDNFSSIL